MVKNATSERESYFKDPKSTTETAGEKIRQYELN
jgi:hypothetical protein